PAVASVPHVFQHADMQFQFLIALGGVYERAADVGEMFAIAAQITDGDYDSWFAAFMAAGDRLLGIAEASEAAGDLVSAREAYLRASTYYGEAYFFTYGTKQPDRIVEVWEHSRSAFDRFAALLLPAAEPVTISYEDTTLPGYVLLVDDSGEPRPWLVMNNGSDGTMGDMWVQGAAAGLRRGYNVLLFDGPGQGAALWRQNLHFRPDWEAVLTPVVDFLVARPDVDPEQIVVIGVSQGGFWVPRALAYEHRFAAAVANPGVVDVGASWAARMPPGTIEGLLDAPEEERSQIAAGINQGVAEAMEQNVDFRFTIKMRMAPYGIDNFADLLVQIADYRLTDAEMQQIATPLLIADPEGEQFWPGQSQQLYDGVTRPKELIAFTAAEGADLHCQPKASGLASQRFFDGFARYVATSSATPPPS
ncbi:MAG: prolyl oligopeptidase family serine peptidase, partial [Chloroflexota bacterium]|nr:prolyl oligopeptidase family serine peptidase [Chloroflexota bacterium]